MKQFLMHTLRMDRTQCWLLQTQGLLEWGGHYSYISPVCFDIWIHNHTSSTTTGASSVASERDYRMTMCLPLSSDAVNSWLTWHFPDTWDGLFPIFSLHWYSVFPSAEEHCSTASKELEGLNWGWVQELVRLKAFSKQTSELSDLRKSEILVGSIYFNVKDTRENAVNIKTSG